MRKNYEIRKLFRKLIMVRSKVDRLFAVLVICSMFLTATSFKDSLVFANPCPSDAPVRTFDISAIAVNIVFNNWGDSDAATGVPGSGNKTPGGKIFALEKQSYTGPSGPTAENPYNSSDKIKAAAAINTDTPSYEVQPLVIRCNVGDCIKINLTNKDLPKASVMIKRAQYDVLDAEGNLVGNNTTPGSLEKGESRTYTFFIEDKAENMGAYHIGVMSESFIDLSYSGLWGALIAEPKGSRYLASLNPWKASGGTLVDGASFVTSETPLTWSDWEAIIVPCEGITLGDSPSCDRYLNSPGAFNNGLKNGKIAMGSAPTDNPQGSFREAVSFFHDGIFMSGGRLNNPGKKMTFPVRDPEIKREFHGDPLALEQGAIILPVKGENLDSGEWAFTGAKSSSDGGSIWGQRFAFSTPAGVLGTRGWPMMGPPDPVDPNQEQNNNTSWNQDSFLGVDPDDESTSEHQTNFGKGYNYRSDPFSYMKAIDEDESQSYSSYTFGEPSTICPQAYLGDPMVWRIVHGGGEEHHVLHIHGFTRWAEQPYAEMVADPLTGEILKDANGNPVNGSRSYLRGMLATGGESGNLAESLTLNAALLKHRMDTRTTVTNLVDVTMLAPQEVFDLELECGAGSCHGGPADWVEHCHVADHYVIGMWRLMRVYDTKQSNIAALPGRPRPVEAVNSQELLESGETLDGKKFCSTMLAESDPQNIKSCPSVDFVEDENLVAIEPWVKHLLPSRGVQREGAPDIKLEPERGMVDAEWRNPFYDPFDANRNGVAQDIDGDNTCTGDEDERLSFAVEGDVNSGVVNRDGNAVDTCADGGDPADWVINPPCESLDGTYDPNSAFGQMSIEGLRALSCMINGYDGDHLDWKIVNTINGPLVLNQPDGPLFQNFVEGIGDPQGRWARYRDVKMYKLEDGVASLAENGGLIGPRPGYRAEMLFNPLNGRLEFPSLRALRGMRPPFPPNNHSGAPTVGEKSTIVGITPDATRKQAVDTILSANKKDLGKYPDGLCPPNAPVRSYDIVATIAMDISGRSDQGIRGVIYNRFGDTDPNAVVHSLRNDEVDILAHKRSPEQLAIRCNVGDCVDIQFRSHATDFSPIQDNFSKLNMHTHMIHFDPTGSDGVIVGYNWEQSVRPCTDIGQVVDAVSATKDVFGESALGLAKEMQYQSEGPPALGSGEGPTHNVLVPDAIDGVANAAGVDPIGIERLENALAWGGRPWEYVHYRWYADIQMMAFWHPHIGGFISFPLGTTDGTIVEPKGSVYRDRITGQEKYTDTNKVIQNPLFVSLNLGDGLRNDSSKFPISGTPEGFPLIEDAGIVSDFGGNPVLGWALGMLDFEEQTKMINVTAALNNRRPQTGEDIPLFGKVDFRGGPSGLEADDCGGITNAENIRGVVEILVNGADPSTVTLNPEVFLKHTNGDCTGDSSGDLVTDDSGMGASSSVLTANKNGTLNTNRIFNRTNSLYDVDPNSFQRLEDSGNTESVDIVTTSDTDLGKKIEPSFRETVFWWLDDIYLMLGEGTNAEPFNNRVAATSGVSAITLRNEPLDRRVSLGGLKQHKVFTSNSNVGDASGDPSTPLMLAHPGDRYLVRAFGGGTNDMHAFRFLGQRFANERSSATSNPIDTFQNSIAYFNTYELMGGAGSSFIDDGGKQHNLSGDYLYYLPVTATDFAAGGWGLLRVDQNAADSSGSLQPLDDKQDLIVGGDPCEGKTVNSFDVTAVSISDPKVTPLTKSIFVRTDASGKPLPGVVETAQPLVLRVVSGECIEVTLHPHKLDNVDRRVGLTAGLLVGDPKINYGVNVGKNLDNGGSDQTVGSFSKDPTGSVTYRWLASKQTIYDLAHPDAGTSGGVIGWAGTASGTQEKELGTVYLSSLVDPVNDLNEGLFGAIVVEPEGASWISEGGIMGDVVADITTPDGKFREFVIIMHEASILFQSSLRPQKNFLGGINYRISGDGPPFVDVNEGLVFHAEPGTPTRIRLIYANGSEDRTFTVNGHRWGVESDTVGTRSVSVISMNVGMRYDIELEGNDTNGDGKADPGVSIFPGDYFLGVSEHRSAMAGQWGVIRVGEEPESVTVNTVPQMFRKSIFLQSVLVSVRNPNGLPASGVNVNAIVSGSGTVIVEPVSKTTNALGQALFKFKFGLDSVNGMITFRTDDGSTAILVQDATFPFAATN